MRSRLQGRGEKARVNRTKAAMTPEDIAALRRRRYNATVESLHKANPDLMIVRVRPDSPVAPHTPGQYAALGLGNWEPRFPGCQDEDLLPADEARVVLRSYSISHPILLDGRLAKPQNQWLEFYIVLVR